MLNTDYKILAKLIAERLKQHISKLIHHDQTGFLKGRFIGENINKILNVMEYCEMKNLKGMIVNIDFEKAFDSIEWSHIMRTLKFFNFGPNIIKWIEILYKNTCSKVINNGWVTNSFQITRGLRQGCPLSPYIFILAVEPLAHNIRKNTNIKGLSVNNCRTKLSQYADDTELFIAAEENSLKEIFSTFKKFELLSGLKINIDKTEILPIGCTVNEDISFLNNYECRITDHITVLGIEIWANLNMTLSKNYTKRINTIKKTLLVWNQRQITMYGRILLVKSLVLSQFNYLLACLPAPADDKIKMIDDIILKFIRAYKSAQQISKETLQLNKDMGGLQLTLLQHQTAGIKSVGLKGYVNPTIMNSG